MDDKRYIIWVIIILVATMFLVSCKKTGKSVEDWLDGKDYISGKELEEYKRWLADQTPTPGIVEKTWACIRFGAGLIYDTGSVMVDDTVRAGTCIGRWIAGPTEIADPKDVDEWKPAPTPTPDISWEMVDPTDITLPGLDTSCNKVDDCYEKGKRFCSSDRRYVYQMECVERNCERREDDCFWWGVGILCLENQNIFGAACDIDAAVEKKATEIQSASNTPSATPS